MKEYTVEQELKLTHEMHLLPVFKELLQFAGFEESIAPDRLMLAQVHITGARYGGQWGVSAVVHDRAADSYTLVGNMMCAPGVDRDNVLRVADAWVRASDSVSFVPGMLHPIPTPAADEPYFVYGVMLVRG